MKAENLKNNNFIYFGSSDFSVFVLDELKKEGFLPKLIITTPDKPKGRKLVLTPTPVKIWAQNENIEVLEPKTLKTEEFFEILKSKGEFDLSVVASYGKIIPDNILDFPKFKTLNVHPSLLPKLRGPSPIVTSILKESETGVTIILLDNEIDHGPILVQEKINIEWPPYENELEKLLGNLGGKMLAEIIPKWTNSEIKEVPQNHNEATFTSKIEKTDGEINFNDSIDTNLRKIRGFVTWPGAYFFKEVNGQKKRIVVKSASIKDGELVLERIIPEGKKEMNYNDFLRGLK